jgi:Tfp pilus assembly protein PilO
MNSRILPALAMLVAGLILFFYIRPTWNGPVAQSKAAIAFDEQALAAASEYQAQQSSLTAERAAIDPANLTRLSAFLPDSVDNVGLILDLNALAARSGLSLANIDVITEDTRPGQQALPADAQNPVGAISLSLTAAGTYGALQTFLAGVERSARLLDVQDLVVKGSETGVYTYELTLRLYWLR